MFCVTMLSLNSFVRSVRESFVVLGELTAHSSEEFLLFLGHFPTRPSIGNRQNNTRVQEFKVLRLFVPRGL